MANDVIRQLRTAYLQHHPQGPEAPGDGGEFEKVLRVERSKTDNLYFHTTIGNLENAHNADRAADKRRIIELEAENAKLKQMKLSVIMDGESDKDKRIAELEAQLAAAKKLRVMKRYHEEKPKVAGTYWWHRAGHYLVAHFICGEWRYGSSPIDDPDYWLELEPTPTLPESSDMIAGDGD